MNLLWLNISIGLLVTLVLIIRNYSRKISAYFFSLLWEAILIKLLLSFLIPVCKNIINKCFVEAVDTASENLNWGIFENLNLKYIYVWMGIGFVLILLFFLNYWLLLKQIRKFRKDSSRYAEFENKLSNTYKANIKICDWIQSPLTFGFFRTTILMPISTLTMTEKEQHYLIYHEKIHVKHRDSAWKMLAVLIAAIYWFNPFLWLLVKYFNQDLELRCDHKVITELGDNKWYQEYGVSYNKEKKLWQYDGKDIYIFYDPDGYKMIQGNVKSTDGVSLKVIRNSQGKIDNVKTMKNDEINLYAKELLD